MGSERENNGDPRSLLPEMAGDLRAPNEAEQRQSLANLLVPTVDVVRQIAVDMGVRPFRVFLVHVAWSGGTIGVGDPTVQGRVEITPSPRVRNVGGMDETVRAVGTTEEGFVEIDRISARFTEDDLLGRTADLLDPDNLRTSQDGVEFFWEIQETRPSRPYPAVRRFAVQGVPELRRGAAEWTVRLVKQEYDPSRAHGLDREDAP